MDSQVTNTWSVKTDRFVCSCRSLFATCWARASSALLSLFSLIKISSLCAVSLFTVSHEWHMRADGCAELPSSAQLTSAAWVTHDSGENKWIKYSLWLIPVFVCYFWHSSHQHRFWDEDTMRPCNSSFFLISWQSLSQTRNGAILKVLTLSSPRVSLGLKERTSARHSGWGRSCEYSPKLS